MPRVALTRQFLARLKPTARVIYYDEADDPPGFAIRVEPATPRKPAGTRSWILDYRIGRDRRRWTIGRYPALTLDRAREKARQGYDLARDGIDPREQIEQRATAMSIETFGALFLAEHSRQLKPATYRDHEQLLRLHIIPWLGDRKVATLTPHDVASWQRKLPQRRQSGKALALLHEMMERAESPLPPWNALRSPQSNPAHKIPIIKGKRSDDRFDDDELAAIWAAITRCERAGEISIWAAGCIRCVMLTGARFREMAGDRHYPDMGAHWSRLDVARERLTIVDHKSSRTRGPKVLELATEVVVEMQRMPRVDGGAYIFANARFPTRPIGYGARNALAVVLKRGGIDHGGLHAFRRTLSDVHDQLGTPLGHSAAQLGHARESTTEGYQSREKQRQARQAVRVFAAEMLRRVRA